MRLRQRAPLYQEAAREFAGNAAQSRAYDCVGHCVVLAGPGSGKTKLLTTKIARILAEDVRPPRAVACITYSNECATEIRLRLARLGVVSNPGLFVGTVHGFCLRHIVLPFAHLAGLDVRTLTVASDRERKIALENAYEKVINEDEDPHKVWRNQLDRHRRGNPSRNESDWQSKGELSRLVLAYEGELRALGRMDFDDIVLSATRLVEEHDWVSNCVRAKFPALVIDEYQDLGVPLDRLVRRLCLPDGSRLFAVGDPDQSIYGFTGARPRLLRELGQEETIEKVQLEVNYRCSKSIIHASFAALDEERDFHTPDGTEEGLVTFHACRGNLSAQAAFVFEKLLPSLLSGPAGCVGEIAVLYPAAWIGEFVAEAAADRSIPVVRSDSQAPYPRSNRVIQWLEELARWCCGGWSDGSVRLTSLVHQATLLSRARFEAGSVNQLRRSLIQFAWPRRNAAQSLRAWLDQASEIVVELQRAGAATEEDLRALGALRAAVAENGPLEGKELAYFAGQSGSPDHLNLITLHSAKGREFDAVILFCMEDGRLPRRGATPRQVQEARRLFYVGMTRARQRVCVTFAKGKHSEVVVEVFKRLQEREESV